MGASVSARAHAKLSTPPLSCHRKVLGAGVHKRVLPPSSGTSKALLPARVDGATGPLVLHTAKGLPSLPSALPLRVFGVREVLSCFRLDFQLDNSCTSQYATSQQMRVHSCKLTAINIFQTTTRGQRRQRRPRRY